MDGMTAMMDAQGWMEKVIYRGGCPNKKRKS